MSEQEKIKKLNIAVAVLNFIFAAMLLCGAIYFTHVTVYYLTHVISDTENGEPVGSILVVFFVLFAKALRGLIIFIFGTGAIASYIDCAFRIFTGVLLLNSPVLRTGNGYRLLRSFGYAFDTLFVLLIFLLCLSRPLLFIPFALLLALLITKAILNKKLLKLIRTAHPPQEPFEL